MSSLRETTACGDSTAKLLQAWMPSAHVCSNVESLESPHFLNQAPPRAQQLRLPDFLVVPHLGHPVLLLGADVLVVVSDVPVVVCVSVGCGDDAGVELAQQTQ